MSQLKQVTFHRRGPAAGASSAAVTCDESDASGERAARIVLIDDDEVFLPAQVRQALSASRTEITSAKTGAAGVDLVRGDRPDLVLLGLRLPDQAGFAVYEEIRAIDALVPAPCVRIVAASTRRGLGGA
jgi:CheY-like chemotaxis protein